MNVEEMIASINAKVTKDAERKAAAEKAARDHDADLISKIRDLAPRIQKLLKVTWYAYDKGMPIVSTNYEGVYFQNDRFHIGCDGFYHNIGIIDPRSIDPRWDPHIGVSNHREYLCVKAGGACGVYDFYTSGDNTFSHHEDDRTGTQLAPRTRDMEQFLKNYDKFETKLLAYIDEWCKE